MSRNSVASMRWPCPMRLVDLEPVAVAESQDLGPRRGLRARPRPGEWSGWVCVQRIQRMRSPPQPVTASRWAASSGPGSITAISSMPTR